ncbi:biogenesis of lysosome-related organelles complex 1 subunit 6-like [Babylonia areolata]|uniref:biogenesis of lysosome-related organelles complex 1 subunit 6-like n=1 Tax=Babylonia areolata TaxID=304850 RepID=UPI003FD23A71
MSGTEAETENSTHAEPHVSPPMTSADDRPGSVGTGQSEMNCGEGRTDTEQSRQVYELEPSDDSTFRMGQGVCVDPSAVRQLSEGFLERFLPALERSRCSADEVLNNQMVVMETLEQENTKFKDCTAHLDLSAMMARAKLYHSKLLSIKRDMSGLHDKAAKLKRRALKLQQQKQKEELQRAHEEERQLEKEQMLTARVASPET